LRQPFRADLTKSALKEADLIAAGTARKITRRGEAMTRHDGIMRTPGRIVQSLVEVDRVFKGPAVRVVTVEFFLPDDPELARDEGIAPPGKRCLLLLSRKSDDGDVYVPRSVHDPALLLAPTPPPVPGRDAAVQERLRDEVLAAIRPDTADHTCRVLRNLIFLRSRSEPALGKLEELSADRSAAVVGSALAARLALGDGSAVAKLVALEEKGDLRGEQRIDFELACKSLTSPEDIPSLVVMLSAKSAWFRREAAYRLRRMKDPRAVPLLGKLLQDGDRTVQYHALMGLSEHAQGMYGWGPGAALFEKNPDYYVNRWRQWWLANRHRFTDDGEEK
jgi:hypothetical protein